MHVNQFPAGGNIVSGSQMTPLLGYLDFILRSVSTSTQQVNIPEVYALHIILLSLDGTGYVIHKQLDQITVARGNDDGKVIPMVEINNGRGNSH